MTATRIRIATRASNLALWQANFVAGLVRSLEPTADIELVHVTTRGDRRSSGNLGEQSVGIFTREIQQAVLDERADVAVHSLKDLPTEPVEGICLAAVPERASPWDALILPAMRPPHVAAIGDLPPRARIGTGSLRRRAQLLHRRSDFEFVTVRGNVETRLRKLDEGACDALVLAEAGLDRLGLSSRISMRLSPPELHPAAGQGALGVECLESATSVRQLLARLSHAGTLSAVLAERRVLARLEAGCHAPVGVSTSLDGDQLGLEAVVLSRDGKERLCAKSAGSIADAEEIGERVAEDLLRQGAGHFVSAAG